MGYLDWNLTTTYRYIPKVREGVPPPIPASRGVFFSPPLSPPPPPSPPPSAPAPPTPVPAAAASPEGRQYKCRR